MAVKASRYLTHIKRLHDPAEPVQRLLNAAAGLADRLDPVLLQLPPNLPANVGALDACLREFSRFPASDQSPSASAAELTAPAGRRGAAEATDSRVLVAVEFRPPRSAGRIGSGIRVTSLWRTADWGYLRFHEGAGRPWPRYGERALRSWVQRVAETWPGDADIFVYFNNDQGGAAVHDAAAFAAIARRAATRLAMPGR